MVGEEEVARAHREFQMEFKPKENKSISDGRNLVMSKEMKVRVDDFEFFVSTKILPRHLRLLSSAKVNEDSFDYDETIVPFAEFLADICINKEYDKEWWIRYNEDNGYLPQIVQYIVKDCEIQSPKIETFR